MTSLLGTGTIGQFRRRSILQGFASAMNLRGNTYRLYRMGSTPDEVDRAAIEADWRQVGQDLRGVMAARPVR